MSRAGAALALLLAGCTSMVSPPPPPADPVHVYLLQEALHTGLVLPPARDDGDAEFVEFGFGDWSWYALGNEAWYDTFATVLWPTRGALGRRTFGARSESDLLRTVTWARLSPIVVSAGKANALRDRLQADFDAHHEHAVARPDLRFHFVPIDAPYWFPHNCADVAADWLRELDCHVLPAPIRRALCLQSADHQD